MILKRCYELLLLDIWLILLYIIIKMILSVFIIVIQENTTDKEIYKNYLIVQATKIKRHIVLTVYDNGCQP